MGQRALVTHPGSVRCATAQAERGDGSYHDPERAKLALLLIQRLREVLNP